MKTFSIRALFRLDGTSEIGMGHLSRCLNLARYLRYFEIRSTFVVSQSTLRYFPSTLSEFEVVCVPDESSETEDADFTLQHARAVGAKIVVVDSYGLGIGWQSKVRAEGYFLVAIDDLERDHNASLLIDYNVRLDYDSIYESSKPQCGELLLGPAYAILNEEYSRLRKVLPAWENRSQAVHICFGGSDPKNITAVALEACKSLAPLHTHFDIVVGEGYSFFDSLRAKYASEPHYSITQNPPDLPARMASARLAIGAGGTMHWERCVLGLPTIVVSSAGNQEPASLALDSLRVVRYLGHVENIQSDSIANAVIELLQDDMLLYEMSLRAMGLVDGRGTKRVACSILSSFLRLEAAGPEHAERIFAWRNHPDNRKTSLDQGEINWNDHLRWFEETLRSNNRKLFVATLENESIGVLRLDFVPGQAWVSIYLVPEFHRSRLGLPLLLKVPELLHDAPEAIGQLRAQIRHGNPASESIFTDAGYECFDKGAGSAFSEWRKVLTPKRGARR